jgi:hypothetical protein
LISTFDILVSTGSQLIYNLLAKAQHEKHETGTRQAMSWSLTDNKLSGQCNLTTQIEKCRIKKNINSTNGDRVRSTMRGQLVTFCNIISNYLHAVHFKVLVLNNIIIFVTPNYHSVNSLFHCYCHF